MKFGIGAHRLYCESREEVEKWELHLEAEKGEQDLDSSGGKKIAYLTSK